LPPDNIDPDVSKMKRMFGRSDCACATMEGAVTAAAAPNKTPSFLFVMTSFSS